MSHDPFPEITDLEKRAAEVGQQRKPRCPKGHETGARLMGIEQGQLAYWGALCGRKWWEKRGA